VNLSPVQFRVGDIVGTVRTALRANDGETATPREFTLEDA
jgi:hypothetical protein